MWTIEQKITELIEKRGPIVPTVKITEGVENYTTNQILNLAELQELFDLSRRCRDRLVSIRSYWDISLVASIANKLKTFLLHDENYQSIFPKNFGIIDPNNGFESYNSHYHIFKNAVWFLENNKCFTELTDLLNFLRGLEPDSDHPFSDEALEKRLSS